MNQPIIYIRSFATIDASGITTPKTSICWEADQSGPADIRRAQVLTNAYVAFGKLNLPDKLAFSAASLALRDSPGGNDNRMGVFLAIPGGSYSTDCLYRDSVAQGNPSPALFSATLPSSAVADIAIYHHLIGPNIVFAGGDSPFATALHYVVLMLQCEQLKEAFLILVDEPASTDPTSSAAAGSPSATALLLGTSPGDSQSTALSLELEAVVSSSELTTVNDTQLCYALTDALKKSTSVRLPVCGGGFRGYIWLKSH